MKKLALLGLVWLTFTTISFGQCNVQETNSDGHILYMCANEKIYGNSDLAYGILAAHASLSFFSSPDGTGAPYINLMVGTSGNKGPLVPRKIIVTFSDGSELNFSPEKIENPQSLGTVRAEKTYGKLTNEQFAMFYKKSVSQFKIIDTRSGNEIISQPYKDLFKEQADCLIKSVFKK